VRPSRTARAGDPFTCPLNLKDHLVRSISRRPTSLLPVALVAIVVLVGGCTGQSEAKSYSKSVQEEFLFGCTTGGEARTEDGTLIQSDTTDPEEKKQVEEAKDRMRDEVPQIDDICACTYDKLEEDVPFGDLKDMTDDLEREPDALPNELTKISDACAKSEGGSN
jgi:hypothetical protein